jgi:hypothetical protein
VLDQKKKDMRRRVAHFDVDFVTAVVVMMDEFKDGDGRRFMQPSVVRPHQVRKDSEMLYLWVPSLKRPRLQYVIAWIHSKIFRFGERSTWHSTSEFFLMMLAPGA